MCIILVIYVMTWTIILVIYFCRFSCLSSLSFSITFSLQVVMVGKRQARKSKWLIGYFFVLAISYLDLVVSLGFNCREVRSSQGVNLALNAIITAK